MSKYNNIIKGFGYAFGFFALYYVISVAVSLVTELAVILRYFPEFYTENASLNREQYEFFIKKFYSLNGVMSITTTVLVIVITAIIFKVKGFDSKSILGIKKPKRNFIWLSYFGGVFTGVTLSTLLAMVPVPESWLNANGEAVEAVTQGNIIFVMISVFISAPLVEEFVFRGLMMGFMKKYVNTAVAVVVTALIFAVVHGNILQGIYTFIAALIFSYFRLRGKSFWCAFLAHCGFNMSNILIVALGDTSIYLKFAVGIVSLSVILFGTEFVFNDNRKGNN